MTHPAFHCPIAVVPILVLGMVVQTTTNFIATSVEV